MISSDGIRVPADVLTDFCRRWKIQELSIFGSALRKDFNSDSDIDLVVTFAEDADWTLLDRSRMVEELTSLIGRSVDVVEARSLSNPFRRRNILSTRKVIYAA
jgi:predicted nucleotidyltransferase